MVVFFLEALSMCVTNCVYVCVWKLKKKHKIIKFLSLPNHNLISASKSTHIP